MDLRYESALTASHVIGVEYTRVEGMRLIQAGDKDRSMVYHYLSNRGADRMPPVDTTVVDWRARNLVGAWIDSLK